MTSLYNIDNNLKQIINKINESDEGFTTEMQEYLSNNKLAFEQKAEGICYVVNQCNDMADNIDKEIKRLQTLKKQRENLAKRIKEMLLKSLELRGETKLDLEMFKIHTRKGAVSVFISDENKIPAKYKKATLKYNIDKNSIKKELKEGKKIEGATLQEGNTSIIIT